MLLFTITLGGLLLMMGNHFTTLDRYVDHRQKEEAENATINRELALLKRAFRLGVEHSKIRQVPHFEMLDESGNVREGFLEDAQYDKLATECAREGLWLRAMFALYHSYGWRKTEVLGLRVNQIDLDRRTIRLKRGTTKNKEGRFVTMTDEIFQLISASVQGKSPSDFVFTRDDGKPVRSFRKTWAKVCEAAGLPDLMIHDLRRTGARNLRRLGVAEKVAMEIGGWKTRSVFERYNIVDESDLQEAAQKLDAKREERVKASEFRHSSDTVEGFPQLESAKTPSSRLN